MRRNTTWCLLAVALVATDALAADTSYNFIQGDVLFPVWSHSGRSTEGSGFAIHGSAAIGSRLFGFADGDMVGYTMRNRASRLRSGSLGLGIHLPLGSAYEVTGTVSFERVRLKDTENPRNFSESGWGLGIGIRVWTTERFQLNLDCRYQQAGDLASAPMVSFGGRYQITPAFSIGPQFSARRRDEKEEDMNEFIPALMFRYDFHRT